MCNYVSTARYAGVCIEDFSLDSIDGGSEPSVWQSRIKLSVIIDTRDLGPVAPTPNKR